MTTNTNKPKKLSAMNITELQAKLKEAPPHNTQLTEEIRNYIQRQRERNNKYKRNNKKQINQTDDKINQQNKQFRNMADKYINLDDDNDSKDTEQPIPLNQFKNNSLREAVKQLREYQTENGLQQPEQNEPEQNEPGSSAVSMGEATRQLREYYAKRYARPTTVIPDLNIQQQTVKPVKSTWKTHQKKLDDEKAQEQNIDTFLQFLKPCIQSYIKMMNY